jgi:hypothetical protein
VSLLFKIRGKDLLYRILGFITNHKQTN